jgi:hypothetical protein
MNRSAEAVAAGKGLVSPGADSDSLKELSYSVLTAPGLTNILLLLIALALLATAVRPIFTPKPVQAESHPERRLFIEPGVQVLHTSDLSKNVYGRVVIDLRTGNVWGFPTPSGDPYPFQSTNDKLQTSHPFLLGRFALEDLDK